MTQSATQTSPEDAAAAGGAPGGLKFTLGSSAAPKDENPLRFSPKNVRKERAAKPLRAKRDRPVSPGGAFPRGPSEKVREAMSPSVAECLRAVFAAFLWHEGIVHDAMACASYLKFHPDLTKQGTFLWKLRQEAKPAAATPKGETKLTKEQKARQRHSVEVSAYSYLNVTVQNKEDLSKLGPNANILEEAKAQQEASCKLATVLEAGADALDLPLVLRHVVLLWEELAANCLKAIAQQLVLPSPTLPARLKKEKAKEKEKRRSKKKTQAGGGPSSKQLGAEALPDEGDEDGGGQCEMCGQAVPQQGFEPHFIAAHPGCGNTSHGCGYVGARWKFFPSKERLPLPCGQVFRGCYHMCWSCRNKFRGQSSHLTLGRDPGRKGKRKAGVRLLSPLPTVETHIVMRNNAMFLLDLASAASSHILTRPNPARKSPCPMPCVSELSPEASPFPKVRNPLSSASSCRRAALLTPFSLSPARWRFSASTRSTASSST